MDSLESEELKRKLNFNFQEQEIIKELGIKPEVFLPLIFSLKFGGNWSIKTRIDSLKVMAIKDKLTRYNPEKMIGSTLETIFLISNPSILKKEGQIYRLEKCSENKERMVVKRPYKLYIGGENIIKAVLNPKTLEITLKHVKGPLSLEGSAAFGASHEMDHLSGSESWAGKEGRKDFLNEIEHLKGSKKADGKCLWDFSYQILK